MATEAQILEVKFRNKAISEAGRQASITYGHYEREYRVNPASALCTFLWAEANRLNDLWFNAIDACHNLEVLYGIDAD